MSAQNFVNRPEVKRCLKDLKPLFGKTVSGDLVDDAGNQYVDLVNDGGIMSCFPMDLFHARGRMPAAYSP